MVNDLDERKELIKFSGAYYLVSRVILPGTYDEWETMIFPANEHGEVINWLEEYCNRGYEPITDSVIKFIGTDHELSDVEGDLD